MMYRKKFKHKHMNKLSSIKWNFTNSKNKLMVSISIDSRMSYSLQFVDISVYTHRHLVIFIITNYYEGNII